MNGKIVLLTILALVAPSLAAADVCQRLEAEDFSRISGSMELVHDSRCASDDGTWVGAPNGSSPHADLDDEVRYVFRPKVDGTYYFKGRVHAPTGADDSFCVRIEDATGAVLGSPYSPECGDDIYWDFWATGMCQTFELRNGWNSIPQQNQPIVYQSFQGGAAYSITLRRRENGTMLDWLELCQVVDQDASDPSIEQEADTGMN